MSVATAAAPAPFISAPTRYSMENANHSTPILEGWLEKVGGYFRLYADQLHYFENERALVPKGSILLPGSHLLVYSAEIHPSHSFTFGLTSPSSPRTYIFAALNNESRMQWVKCMKILCDSTIKSEKNSVKEGFLVKQGGRVKSWKRRWAILTPNSLNYYSDITTLTVPKGNVDLAGTFDVQSDSIPGSPEAPYVFSIQISGGTRVYKFGCISDRERSEWLSVLGKLKAQAENQLLTFAKGVEK